MIFRIAWIIIFISRSTASQLYRTPIYGIRTTVSNADQLFEELKRLQNIYPQSTTMSDADRIMEELKHLYPQTTTTTTTTPSPPPDIDIPESEDNDQQQNQEGTSDDQQTNRQGKGNGQQMNNRGGGNGKEKNNRGGGRNNEKKNRLGKTMVLEDKKGNNGGRGQSSTSPSRNSDTTHEIETVNSTKTNSSILALKPMVPTRLTNLSNSMTVYDMKSQVTNMTVEDLNTSYRQLKDLIIIAIVVQVIVTVLGVCIVVAFLHMKFAQLYMAVEIVPETYEPRSQYVRSRV